MKVTEASTFRLMQTNLERITSKLQDLRNQGATGLKLNKPSDDPASIRPVLTTRTQIRDTDRYLETMGVTADKMAATDGYMAGIENVLQRAKEITINAINGAMSTADLDTLANEISELKQQLLDSANATVDGKYIFSGYMESTKPFTVNPAYTPGSYLANDSRTWPYLYNGDANPTQLEITPGEYLDATITGNQLFLGVSNGNWVYSAPPNPPAQALNQPEAGHVDLFSVLTRVEEAIRANNIDDPLGAGGGMQANLDNLESAANQERVLRSRLGNRATRVEAATRQEESVKVDLQQILSRYQDADSIATFNDISKQETAFQAALSITAKVSKISILDYL
jgi:flagellar hook-associated protein 3 FlgL